MVSSPGFSSGSIECGHISLNLPKLRLPKGQSTSSLRSIQVSPRTPRRRIGRLNAGAALSFFTVPELSTFDPRICSPTSSPSASSITSPVHPTLKVNAGLSQDHQSSFYHSSPHKCLKGQNHQRNITAAHRSRTSIRTHAKFQSSDGDQDRSATRDGVSTKEKSQMVNEELLLFFFQLDLGTRLQVSIVFVADVDFQFGLRGN